MNMGPMGTRHIELVRAVNEAKNEHDHREAQVFLDGFHDCMKHAGSNLGAAIIAAVAASY